MDLPEKPSLGAGAVPNTCMARLRPGKRRPSAGGGGAPTAAPPAGTRLEEPLPSFRPSCVWSGPAPAARRVGSSWEPAGCPGGVQEAGGGQGSCISEAALWGAWEPGPAKTIRETARIMCRENRDPRTPAPSHAGNQGPRAERLPSAAEQDSARGAGRGAPSLPLSSHQASGPEQGTVP